MAAFCDEPTAVPQVIDKGDENEGMKMKEKNDADSIEAPATASTRTVAHYAFTARAVRRPSRSTNTVPTNDLPSRPAQRPSPQPNDSAPTNDHDSSATALGHTLAPQPTGKRPMNACRQHVPGSADQEPNDRHQPLTTPPPTKPQGPERHSMTEAWSRPAWGADARVASQMARRGEE